MKAYEVKLMVEAIMYYERIDYSKAKEGSSQKELHSGRIEYIVNKIIQTIGKQSLRLIYPNNIEQDLARDLCKVLCLY